MKKFVQFFFVFHIIHLKCCLEIKKINSYKLKNKNKTLFNGVIKEVSKSDLTIGKNKLFTQNSERINTCKNCE
jgi:hypothetical protein